MANYIQTSDKYNMHIQIIPPQSSLKPPPLTIPTQSQIKKKKFRDTSQKNHTKPSWSSVKAGR
jgi:hypothetical protein